MTLLVPFDGSTLSEAALSRAVQFGDAFDQPVLAVTVVPRGNVTYAREQGWIERGESFDLDTITERLRSQVHQRAPDASFQVKAVSRDARTGSIARIIRQLARTEEALMVFVGSDNAGRLVTTLSSVGGNVAADQNYDVVLVRQATPLPLTDSKLADAE